MADPKPGSWYRLIGGERVCVEALDVETGIVSIRDTSGEIYSLARSAFAGSIPESPTRTSTRNVASAKVGAADLAEGNNREPETFPETSAVEGVPEPAPFEVSSGETDLNEMQEKTMQEAQDARDADLGEPVTATESREGVVPSRYDAPGAREPDHGTDDGDPGVNREFDFDDPEHDPAHGSGQGLSPLALGMLLGMLLLAGIAGWLVLQSRLDNLEVQFGQLDERLQVVMGDTRRQGEALRTYLADPNTPRPVLPSPAPSAMAQPPETEGAVAALERQLAAQIERVGALEKRLAEQDAALAELDRRAERLEKRPAQVATAPKPDPEPKPKPEPKPEPALAPDRTATPSEPPSGFVVVLASLPVRAQALQELDRLRDKGLSVVLREARIKEATWYRVQAEGFRDRDSATAFARSAESRHGVAGAWVVAP